MLTVFTSSYNHGQYLRRAIESVLAQTYKDFEYILVDDCSDDDSFEVMCSYAKQDNRITVLRLNSRLNVGQVINRSISMMKGTHWLWCPADDVWSRELLKVKFKYSRLLPPDAIIYNDFYIINENGETIDSSHLKDLNPEMLANEVWHSSPIGFTGIMIPKSVLVEIPFPTHLEYSEDYFWMVKATIHGHPFYHCREHLHYKRKHANSLTSKNYSQILDGVYHIRKHLKEYKDNYDR